MEMNEEKLTMFIENADLIGKHIEIVFNNQCQYVLRNFAGRNKEGVEEAKGDMNEGETWVRIPHGSLPGLDLFQDNNYKRDFKVGPLRFNFASREEPLLEIERWISENKMDYAYTLIKMLKISKIEELMALTKDQIRRYISNEQEQNHFVSAIKQLKEVRSGGGVQRQLIMEFKNHVLQDVVVQPSKGLDLVQDPAYVRNPDAKLVLDPIEGFSNLNVHIVPEEGTLFMRSEPVKALDADPLEQASVFYQLYKDEELVLQPGTVLQIGLLTFVVERFNTGVISEIGNRN
mmetsp:Transcript_32746/g.24166  ORF Transcript_32746/g.24166 Transcript_32746/m.24166 type:complete len:289 (-) Transcript_32746:228-1094(-)